MIARQNQQNVINYTGGYLGVAAVPGSGKTWTLSNLAARLISDGRIINEQKILIVTLANSAVENFAHQINLMIKDVGLLPGFGYQVRTLHSIAHQIVRNRPSLAGVSEDFKIVDDIASRKILKRIVDDWFYSHPNFLDSYFLNELFQNEDRLNEVRNHDFRQYLYSINEHLITYAKDSLFSVEEIEQRLKTKNESLLLVTMVSEVFKAYQKALAYRGAVDFSDLISLANKVLEGESGYLESIRSKWPYILEDEAQDSSHLQETILRKIVGPNGNWVRVGDPNQAIYETFTTANPKYLREFIRSSSQSVELPNSGRSAIPVINVANHLISWTEQSHPLIEARDALSPPYILPTEPGDPQPNPSTESSRIVFHNLSLSPEEELDLIVSSCADFVNQKMDKTVAVLVHSNERGNDVVRALKSKGLDAIDNLLQSTLETRKSAGALVHILLYMCDPTSGKQLSTVYRVWKRENQGHDSVHEKNVNFLSGIKLVEEFLYPIGKNVKDLGETDLSVEELTILLEFKEQIIKWQKLRFLSIDQIILSLSRDLFKEGEKLALSFKFARMLKSISLDNPGWGLKELTEELKLISNNQRKFLGFSSDDSGFDPSKYKNQIVVSTIHKAKGLEWDRVYLLGANNFTFPSDMDGDSFMGEKRFVRDRLNLEAEAQGQLKSLFFQSPYDEGSFTEASRTDYVRERIRLFYVAVTRAKSELFVTWNRGKFEWSPNSASLPFLALAEFQDTSK